VAGPFSPEDIDLIATPLRPDNVADTVGPSSLSAAMAFMILCPDTPLVTLSDLLKRSDKKTAKPKKHKPYNKILDPKEIIPFIFLQKIQ
jgi:hypothetical protein